MVYVANKEQIIFKNCGKFVPSRPSSSMLRRTLHMLSRTGTEISSPPTNNPHHSLLFLLNSCKTLKSILQIHCQLIVSGFKPDNITNTRLINSYSSFQKLDFAQFVFNSIPNPSVVLWNSMIKAHLRSNQHKEALNAYHFMLENSSVPDKYTYTFVLKACTGISNLQVGVSIHEEIVNRGLEYDVFIGTGLIDMYCKAGDLVLARDVFDKMPNKDVVVWNAMVAGFSQCPNPHQAFGVFRSMQLEGGMEPNNVSLLNLFPAVSKLLDVKLCKSIHGYVFRRRFSTAVLNGMIDVYSKCGRPDIGNRIFYLMQGRDDVSWGTMMAGYMHNGSYYEVLELFDEMKRVNLKMNKVSAVSALLAAAEVRDLKKGMEIHDCARKNNVDLDVLVATPLMTMYTKCGELEKAKDLFKGLDGKDVVAWSAVIAAFAQSGYPEEALSLFRDMQNESLNPNTVTIVGVLPACAELSAVKIGKSLHCYAVKGNIYTNISTGTALVSMYAKCDHFTSALIIFNRMPHKEIVTYNALINGYVQIGEAVHAMGMFYQLQLSGVRPDAGTMMGVVSASALSSNIGQGSSIHGQINKCGFESDCHVNNALIDMYAKSGSLSSAELLFKKTKITKDEVSWNVMIAGYMQNGHAKEAISAFHQMKFEAFNPNLVTIVSILPAIAYLANIKEGMAIHANIIHMGFQFHIPVGNSLIDMYSKCGRLDYAERIFSEMENKDTVSWNVMLGGYAVNGHGDHACAFFSVMQRSFIEVDPVSFLSVLSACRHSGLVEEGRKIFSSMHEKYHIQPNLEHYACLVDLLGRAGLFDEILALIKAMPMVPDAGVWGALLGACKMHSNVKLAEVALNYLEKIEPENSAHYVVLSSIYAQSGRWGDARNTRMKMNETGLKKNPGCSWVSQKQDLCILSR